MGSSWFCRPSSSRETGPSAWRFGPRWRRAPGRRSPRGAFYTTPDRMEKKGYLVWE